MSLGARPRLDLPKHCTHGAFRDFGVVGRLGAQPVAVGKAEKPAQAQVGVGSNGPFAGHNVSDTLRRHADLLCHAILGDSQWLQA